MANCTGLLNLNPYGLRGFESHCLRQYMETKKFAQLVKLSCKKDTSADPAGWSENNPTWGHCAVVALLAQDYFGGQILRASLKDTPYKSSGSHYRNEDIDFTEEQFGNIQLVLHFEPRSRDYLLSNANTALRYALLKQRFEDFLSSSL